MEFTDVIVQRIWEKARAMPDRDASEWRKDECGAWINRIQYGHMASGYGWKIENTSPGSPHGLDHLRPFHCDNSFNRATGKPHCHITADREGIASTAHIGTPRNRTFG